MPSLGQSFVTAIASLIARQFNDGYEDVSLATDPVQIRLAYQGPSAMMVSWNTFQQLSSPTVSYGLDPNALTLSASSSVSVTYQTSLTYNNHVNLTGLLPYTKYYYLPQYSNATTPYSFTTARAAGDPSPFSVGVVADLGTFGALGLSNVTGTGASHPLALNEQTTITAMEQKLNDYEFVVHAGDISYADYWLKEEIQNYLPTTTTDQGAKVYESILNAFYDEMIDITSAKPYMVNPGNHEANCDNGGTTNTTSGQKYTASICMPGQTNFTGYINHFRMPSGPSGGVGNFWYSYDYGMAHFVHIDTETDLGNGLVGPSENSPEFGGPFGSYLNQQVDWLTKDLASVNRTITPWIVVFGHRGWYLSITSSACANCQTAFEKIFHTYDVDLYINGHAHVYERVQPMYNGVVDPNGLNNPSSTLYITNGAAGHYDGLDSFSTIKSYSVSHTASDYLWNTLTFLDGNHLTINTLWSANNSVFDTATLYKAHVYATNTTTTTSTTSMTSTSTTSSSSSTSTAPTTTTNTPTTTSSTVYPTYTNFNGQGHLFVYTGGVMQGDIGSAGTWYNTPGQNNATYTAVPLVSNNTAFLIQHGSNYCTIGTDSSFGCVVTAANQGTSFGQTPDGNLTYKGSPLFYASSLASSGAKPTVYATPLPVTLNIVWGVDATTPATTTTTSSTSTSTSPSSTSTSTTTSGTVASTSSTTTVLTTTSTTSTTTTGTATKSTTTSTTTTGTSTTSTTTTGTSTTSTTTSTTTTGTATTSTTTTGTSTTSTTTTGTETTSTTTTGTSTTSTTTTGTETTSTTTTGTATSSTTLISSTTTTDTTTTSTTTTETDLATTSTTTTGTATTSTTVTSSTTTTGTATTSTTQTTSTTTTATETDAATVVSTETDSSTVIRTSTMTDTVTFTQSATVTETAQPVTVTVTQSASTATVTAPVSTVTVTHGTSTTTLPGSTSTKYTTSVTTSTVLQTATKTSVTTSTVPQTSTHTSVTYTTVVSVSTRIRTSYTTSTSTSTVVKAATVTN